MPADPASCVRFDGNCPTRSTSTSGARPAERSTYGEVFGGEQAPEGERDHVIFANR